MEKYIYHFRIKFYRTGKSNREMDGVLTRNKQVENFEEYANIKKFMLGDIPELKDVAPKNLSILGLSLIGQSKESLWKRFLKIKNTKKS